MRNSEFNANMYMQNNALEASKAIKPHAHHVTRKNVSKGAYKPSKGLSGGLCILFSGIICGGAMFLPALVAVLVKTF